MLTYRLIDDNDGKFIYEYYPDGDENAAGVISFDKSGNPIKVVDSVADVKRYYAGHACRGISIGKENGVVAWY